MLKYENSREILLMKLGNVSVFIFFCLKQEGVVFDV